MIPNLLLLQESSGVLNWALEGLLLLLADLKEIGDIRTNDHQKAAVESLLCESAERCGQISVDATVRKHEKAEELCQQLIAAAKKNAGLT